MTKYIVEPAEHIKSNERAVLKEALEDLTRLVREFANAHARRIEILDGAWINTTVAVDTDAETAAILARQPGIGKVEPAKTMFPGR